jgi:hypothetical protein
MCPRPLVRHHPGFRVLGRERIRTDVRRGTRQPRVQRGLPCVRRPDQRDLRRAFGVNHQRRAAVPSALPGPFQLFGEVLDPALDVCLQVFGALVLGNRAQHLAQPLQTLARVAALAECGFGRLVVGRKIRGHDITVLASILFLAQFQIPDPAYTGSEHARARFRLAVKIAFGFVALIWLIDTTQWALDLEPDPYGIRPRESAGLPGVLFAPLVHSGFAHLVANSSP